MKAQYQQFIRTHNHKTAINGETLVALNGLTERNHVEYLQDVCADLFPNPQGLKALDMGAAHGVCAMALAELGMQVAAYDMYRSSVAIVHKMAMEQHLNISFRVGGSLQIEQLQEKFDLIHDRDCLTNIPLPLDRARFLQSLRKMLAEDGKLVIRTSILSPQFDPDDSFESICLDADYVLWRQTPESNAPGVVAMNGRHWTAQKRLPPAEVIRQELCRAGFMILDEEIELVPGNNPSILRLVVTSAPGR
ncbi:class I SAM-dependent methyltransferase [Bdellovibrio bacteriovorus]|uniref:class I SAM-dependent methyltransferase n=1 Tax=Bdellovibrio bacteriovorus TaxID=959 RepID=UPI003AA88DB3